VSKRNQYSTMGLYYQDHQTSPKIVITTIKLILNFMINSRILIWTQSYDREGPHFILIINIIFLGFQLLRFQYIRPCKRDEIRIDA
jgi:hypothetical protein